MTITTAVSGMWQRLDGNNIELQKRISESRTVTEYGGQKISIAPGSTDISIRPAGLACIRSLYIETDYEINIELTGIQTASFDLYTDGIFLIMNASLSNVKLSNRNATPTCHPFYDLSG
uniref:Uncharacterized protein n=1 Tax=viral metagenome TaxID=1070528 RepID=A0A6M3LDU2_9ZZZZ